MEATWEANKPEPGAVRSVRHWVGQQAVAWGAADEHVAAAELVTSELVTNAVNHARTAFAVTLKHDDDAGCLRIEVFDGDTRLPSPVHADEGATGGRGLAVVSAVAERWGTELATRADIDGKVVWAEVG